MPKRGCELIDDSGIVEEKLPVIAAIHAAGDERHQDGIALAGALEDDFLVGVIRMEMASISRSEILADGNIARREKTFGMTVVGEGKNHTMVDTGQPPEIRHQRIRKCAITDTQNGLFQPVGDE
ncbi:MAG TPA: hypothetical protein VN130_11955 [Xanthobacteraceae bacterium]|nr:hypothetical protein [Xanthobacteraceae bacterium]